MTKPPNDVLPEGSQQDGEEWRWIANCDNCWAVSNMGRVCSVKRTVRYVNGHVANYKARLLSLVPNEGGYHVVSVRINGKKTCCIVSALVAEAFHGKRPEGLYVLHRNGNNKDDRADNLYYGDAKQNALDAIAHGTKAKHDRHGMAKISPDDVRAIRSLRGILAQRKIAQQFGIGQSQVQRILSGQSWAEPGA